MWLMRMIDRINEAIDASKKSVAEVARACGISVQAVYKWRKGGNDVIEAAHVFAVADLTGFSARWLTLGEGPQRTPPQAPTMTDEEKRLVEHYRAGDDQAKRMLYRAAESIPTYPGAEGGDTEGPAKPRMRA